MIGRCFVVLLLFTLASSLDESVYLKCEERDFCNRLRFKESSSNFDVIPNAALPLSNGVSLLLRNQETNRYVDLNITVFEETTIRLSALEQDRTRYNIPYVLEREQETKETRFDIHEDRILITFPGYQLTVWVEQFRIEVYSEVHQEFVFIFNHDGRFTMESTAASQAFAFDVFFPVAIGSYGIPEHSSHLWLRNTTDVGDPYRLYNADTPGYEYSDSQIGLYGSVPLVYGYGYNHTVGAFLANAAEQWVDITNTQQQGVTGYFMVEDGAFDLYVFVGPTPENVAIQYTELTGTAPIPQLWVLGYHQSSENYLTQDDVKEVVAEFDNNNIPIDVIGGSRATQDAFRYFTWSPETFNDSLGMLNNLSATHRKFITHVNPHYKVDSNYFVYAQGQQNDYFVKNADGFDFVDESLPGDSSWIDFFNEDAADWYGGLFNYRVYLGTTDALGGFVNDLNEPAVFNNSTENTINRNVTHYGNVPHYLVHNMYGFTQSRATYDGLMARDDREIRPFVLSRSFFAGSQRYTAVWTGDNMANWEHLALSYSMCLTLNLAGISLCGANIGGYFGEPDTELLTRWYQAGAWLPLFRAHGSNGTDRREPYLYETQVQNRIRAAIQRRYEHLPLFYTLFHEHSKYGAPVIRPTFYEYPADPFVANIDTQIFVGHNVLVKPVEQPNVTAAGVYFPGGRNQFWYDIDTPLLFRGLGRQTVTVSLNRIPIYYKGGSIIFLKRTQRANTYDMRTDPYTALVFLDIDDRAYGTIYQDDFQSFNYARNQYLYNSVTFEQDNVYIRPLEDNLDYDPNLFIINSYLLYRHPENFRNSESDEPVRVQPIVITKTADGRNIRDLRFDGRTRTTFKVSY